MAQLIYVNTMTTCNVTTGSMYLYLYVYALYHVGLMNTEQSQYSKTPQRAARQLFVYFLKESADGREPHCVLA